MATIEHKLIRKKRLMDVRGVEYVTPAVADYLLGRRGSVAWGVGSLLGPWGTRYHPYDELPGAAADFVALTGDWNTVVCDINSTFEQHGSELKQERLFELDDYSAVGPGTR